MHPDIAFSILLFTAIYVLLAGLWLFLLRREIVRGPEEVPIAEDVAATRPVDTPGPWRCTDMPTLGDIWFLLVGVLLLGYAVLDGFDLGAGVLNPFVAKTDDERRTVLRSIGPVWDGNEVWLLTAGGALFAAFPLVYATVFSGFYLALMLLLAALIFRAVALEFRDQLEGAGWRRAWDVAFFLGSAVPALLLGVAIGNIIRGLPLNAAGEYTGGLIGLLTPFPLIIGLLVVALVTTHGAAWLLVKTQGALAERTRRAALAGLGGAHCCSGSSATLASVALAPGSLGCVHEPAGLDRARRGGRQPRSPSRSWSGPGVTSRRSACQRSGSPG